MRHNNLTWVVLAVIIFINFNFLSAQTYERKIIEYVRMISKGQSGQVISKLPDLKKKIPRSAGLIYVEGLIATNGEEAIKCFSIIADSFPHSEWADDALVRLFEFNRSSGSINAAEQNLEQLRNNYPSSPYFSSNYLHDVRFASFQTSQDHENDYAVQIGAFSIRENAEKLQQRFNSVGYKSDVYENLLDGKNLLFLVWVGSYSNEQEAENIRSEIKNKYNIDGLIRMRSSWKKW